MSSSTILYEQSEVARFLPGDIGMCESCRSIGLVEARPIGDASFSVCVDCSPRDSDVIHEHIYH